MEADYPTHELVVGQSGRASRRRVFACPACLFETQTTLDDGSCPACGGALVPSERAPPSPLEADVEADLEARRLATLGIDAPPAEAAEAQALATLLELLSSTFGSAAGAADFTPAGGRAPQRVIDALPRVRLSPFVELRAYLAPNLDEPAAAVARLVEAKAQPELVLQATNSSFGPALSFLPHGLAAIVEAAAPADGAALVEGAQFAGRIVLMARGGASFAAKVLAAQRARAAGVIVVQRGDVWPFTMADSTGEANGALIPSVMVDRHGGAALHELLERARAAERHVLVHATAHHASSSCAICMELFLVGTDAAQLPCSHCFHEACVAKWLSKSSVCPSCRGPVEVPAPDSGGTAAGAAESERDASSAGVGSREDFAAGISMFG